MQLRPYQEDAANAALDHIRKCIDSCLIEAPTGSGKSWIIAYIAHQIKKMSGKKILVLAPSGELVEQDHEKYLVTGEPASLYSASVGKKSLKHYCVFGSPLTVVNSLQKFSNFAAVVIDEAHNITPTLKKIINHLRGNNPKLRVIGLTATPYRLGDGYIYHRHYEKGYLGEDQAVDPYFDHLVYSIDARMLIDEGFLTKPVFDVADTHYDTSRLEMKKTGQWDGSTVDQAFVGQGRKTSNIVYDIVEKSQNRQGVMIFAATVKHAIEVCESLPGEITQLVTGETPKAERAQILAAFKAKRIKYLVNVSVLTTGFDAPHVDVVAILRATESVALLQQIIGRGLRIDDDKPDCLILDYAENIERHCPTDDVFDPQIRTRVAGAGEAMKVECPACSHENSFTLRPNPEWYMITDEGYFADLRGETIEMDGQKIPAHYGRRCTGGKIVNGTFDRCAYKWSCKECPECGHENDIAARFCTKCRAEIVDPNEKLRIEAKKIASDPYATKIDDVKDMQIQRWPGKNGKADTLRVDYYLKGGKTIPQWFSPEAHSAWLRSKWHQFCDGVWGEKVPDIDAAIDLMNDMKTPSQIAYRKKKGSKYFEVIGVEYSK